MAQPATQVSQHSGTESRHRRRRLGLRAVVAVTVVAMVAVGLPASPVPLPAALRAATASATPGVPIVCSYTGGADWISQPTQLASVNASGGSTLDDSGYDPAISGDGRHVSFTSYSSQHVAGDTNADADIFIRDRIAKTNTLVSRATGASGAQGNDGSVSSAVSADGRHVAFGSDASNLLGGDTNTAASFYGGMSSVDVPDSYLLDLLGDFTIEAWVRTESPGNYQMIVAKASANGGTANNFEFRINPQSQAEFVQVAGGVHNVVGSGAAVAKNRWTHLAITKTGTTITHYLNGQANGTGTINGTVNYVTNPLRIGNRDDLTYGWNGGLDEVAMFKRSLPASRIAAHVAAQTTGYASAVSADSPSSYYRLGESISGTSAADSGSNNLSGTYSGSYPGQSGALTGDNNGVSDIYVRDTLASTTAIVSVATDGAQDNSPNGSATPAISGDGRYVAFYTDAALESGDTNNNYDVYLRDRDSDANGSFDEPGTSTTSRVSVDAAGAQGPRASYFQTMSPDARYLVFNSYNAFDPSDTNNNMDVYLKDRVTGAVTLMSPGVGGATANDVSYFPTVSADGSKVAYYSFASNLVAGDTNAKGDIFVRDRTTATTTMESVSPVGVPANDNNFYPTISGNGRYVAWESSATNLIDNDGNGFSDVFVRDRNTALTTRASLSRTNAAANGGSATFSPGTISADGRYIAFSSGANNLVGDGEDTNTLSDVFVRDQGAFTGHGLAPTLGVEPVAQSDEVGLEQFQPYASTDLGTGTAYTHLRSGNLVASFEDTTIPGQGLNTVIRHVYNSKRANIDTGAGKGWTLAVSDLEGGLEGLAEDVDGAITDFDVSAPITTSSIGEVINGAFAATGQLLEFTDGDGTTHRFIRKGGPCGRWISPAGVSLKVREDFSGPIQIPGLPSAYEFIRPDGVTYTATLRTATGGLPVPEWRITKVTDRRGNMLTYNYATFGAGLGRTRLADISHNRPGQGQVVRFDYTTTGDLDRIVTLPGYLADDLGTPEVTLRSWERQVDYSVDPATKQLLSVTENNHATPAGGVAAQRTTAYGYTGGVLSSVTDGRNNPTTIAYSAGKVASITDRRAKTWTYAIGNPDPGNANRTTTTATSPVGSATTYVMDDRAQQMDAAKDPYKRFWGGTIRSITDAGHGAPNAPITTNFEWTANRLTKTTDGAGVFSSFEYNDLGLLTAVTQPAPNTTARPDGDGAIGMINTPVRSTLRYDYPADFDYAAPCATDNIAGPVSADGGCATAATLVRLASSATPVGQLRITDFQYDAVGNLTDAIQRKSPSLDQAPSALADPLNDRATRFTYYTFGGLKTINGPRSGELIDDITTWGNVAEAAYGGYDRTGMPLTVTDALTKTKTFAYTPYGLTSKVIDRDTRITTSLFDERDNLVRATDPLGRRDTYVYDANDNKTRENQTGAVDGNKPDRYTTWNYDNNDWLVETATPGAAAGQRTYTATVYADDGAKATDVSPRHPTRIYNDAGQQTATPAAAYATNYGYWPNRLAKSVDAPAGTGQRALAESFYDTAGRANRSVGPVANEPGQRPETLTTYNPDGSVAQTRETSAVAALRTADFAYNAHGETVRTDTPETVGGARGAEVNVVDIFGQVTKTRRRIDAGRWTESNTAYDASGNQKSTSQATGNGAQLTSRYLYDALSRLSAQTVDPVNPGHKTKYEYSGEGQQLKRTDHINGSASETIVDGTVFRTAEHAYNADNTQASMVATDYDPTTGAPLSTLASCNYTASPIDGYDTDGNLKTSRTVSGATGCTAGTDQRTQTFDYDDRGWITSTTQQVRSPETGQTVSRTQTSTYDADGAKATTTLSGSSDGSFTTTFTNATSGWTEKVNDWRGLDTTTAYLPSGAPSTQTLGSGVASADYRWHADAMPKSLTWRKGPSPTSGTVVRAHTNIAYDVGGLRRGEDVSTLQPGGATTAGNSTFTYDLLDRLTQWTSPFTDPDAGDRLTNDYALDDGGNITTETAKTQAGVQRTKTTSEYPNGRLSKRTVETNLVPGAPGTTVEDTFEYSGLGEETKRTSKTAGVVTDRVTATTYDPMGHTKLADDQTDTGPLGGGLNEDVAYVYDTADRLISRYEPNLPADANRPKATLYFYWGTGGALAEEADAVGKSLVRYLADSDGETIAQHGYAVVNGRRQTTDTTGTWKWLVPDVNGNVATHLTDNGDVAEQVAYDPYGRPEKGGSSQPEKKLKGSTLGFQGAITDKVTGSVILGARQYDPTTNRFTTADTFVAGELDLALGTDSLTGNRYLFAAANPVSFYEDGHWPSLKSLKKLAKRALPLLGFVPVVGTAIDVVSAATGRDWLNGGKKLNGAERALMLAGAAVGMIPGAGAGVKAAIKVAGKGVGKKMAQKATVAAAKHADELVDSKKDLEGIVYLRTSKTTGEEYVGQAKNELRYIRRQAEHARKMNDEFSFSTIGRAKSGRDLDRLEEDHIRMRGGPRSTRNPTAALANKRHQMSEKRYRAAGGTR